jgi:glycosyltransferase involved in cell wall biosynthesis
MIKSLKILHCANFSESKYGQVYYSIDRKISNGLIRNGHFVYDFSYREVSKNLTFFKRKKIGSKKMNNKLLETIKNLQPDLLLLGHTELVELSTLRFIKKYYPNIKIAMWWVDPFDNSSHINERLPFLDCFFATTSPSYFSRLFTNKTKFLYLPNVCDLSIENLKCYENNNFSNELIFIGRKVESRKKFLEGIEILNKCDFKIFGNDKNSLILGNEFYKTIADSKMALNLSRYNNISLYSSDRIIQLLACGILVFSPNIPDMKKLFTDEEVVYFDNLEDLKEKIYYFNTNDEQRIAISKKGRKKAHKSYNCTRVTKFMIEEIFNENYSEEYEWKDEKIV